MTAPFKDPRTGIYYFRKVIPSELRPAFGKREYKVSLGTRDPVAAKSMMPEHGAAYERLATNAKAFLRGGTTAQGRHYVEQWLQETQRGNWWLQDAYRSLTVFVRLASERGISGPAPDYVFEPEIRHGDDDALMLRTLQGHRRVPPQLCLEVISGLDSSWFEWPVRQIVGHHQLSPDNALADAIALTLKRRLIETVIERLQKKRPEEASPPPLVVINGGLSESGSPRASNPGAEVGLTVTQAFEAWRGYTKGRARKPQLVQEWDLAVRRFVAMFGDVDMGEIRPNGA